MEHPSHQNEEDLLFKGKEIHCRNEQLFKGCADSFLYSGYFKKAEDSKEEEIVVKKIKVIDCCEHWKDIFDKHTREKDPIKHDNVLKIIGYEEMNECWRYFALERYDATLEQFCKGFYKGPMPSDAQVLWQITKGLLYLHKVHCSHGNLTPRTILIASSQPVRIKLSEFGLGKFGDQCDGELGQEQEDELCQKKYWRLDGTTNSNQQTPTPNQDIFAAGCLCFYFLTRGMHPFGSNSSSILENIKKRNPVNLLKTIQQEKHVFAYEPIKNMIGDPPTDGYNWLMIAEEKFKEAISLKVDKKKVLGSGGYGVVYKGTFDGNPVAVKIFFEHQDDAIKADQKREMEEHFPLEHENVLKLLHVDELWDETCLVLELCAGTLTDYCEKKYKGPELPPDGLVLYQIANGLHYIHSRNLVHRDVKPGNILISITTPVQLKLSDFGLVKKTSPRGTFTQRSQQSGLKGTPYWIPPESLEFRKEARKSKSTSFELPHGTIKSDIWAAGCVFFYFLTRGKHPFGSLTNVSENIEHNNPIELKQHKKNLKGDDRALYELIGNMIKPLSEVTREDRISLPEVIQQLTTKLYASRQFKKYERSMLVRARFFCRFHPTQPVLACGVYDQVILLSADNSSIPFSNWKGKETQLEVGNFGRYKKIEWNVDENETQLAAISDEDVIVCWSYPSGKILFQEKLNGAVMNQIEWNPFRPNVFATFLFVSEKVFLFNSCPVDQRSFHFCTIEHEKGIRSVKWISKNRVALGLVEEGIEIWEIDKSATSATLVKGLKHEGVTDGIAEMVWDERTKCLAACSDDGWMTIWSMDSDQPIHTTKVDGDCESLAWRPNGKQTDDAGVDAARKSADNFILACGFGKGKIVIWTPLDSKEKTRILSQHSVTFSHISYVRSLSFSPDGRFLASEDHLGKLIIWATENWEPVYISEEEIRWGNRFSWLASSTDVSDYKLTFESRDSKVRVIEYTVSQGEKPIEDVNDKMNEDRQGITKTFGEFSIGSSGDLK